MALTKGCAAFLFDLDGTIVKSLPAAILVWWNKALAHGLDPEAGT